MCEQTREKKRKDRTHSQGRLLCARPVSLMAHRWATDTERESTGPWTPVVIGSRTWHADGARVYAV